MPPKLMPAHHGHPHTSHSFAKISALLVAVMVSISASRLLAGGGPENALVVVNADSWASTFIANEYIAGRRIPAMNVVRLRNLPDFERMNVEDFRTRILAPALHAAEQRGLGSQIDYVLYSADFPTAIDVTSDLAGQPLPKAITQPAAINGLTYLFPFTMAKNPNYLGLNVNFYYRQPVRWQPEPEWNEEDKKAIGDILTALRSKAGGAAGTSDKTIPAPPTLSSLPPSNDTGLEATLEKMLALKKSHPKSTELLYHLAVVHARMGKPAAAIDALREAVDHGWWDMRSAEMDPDFASIRGREDFAILTARSKLAKFELVPTSGFRSSAGWLPSGEPVAPDKGIRYLLSTVLACTSGRGNSVTEAIAGLQRSIGADGSRPKGTIYFLDNRDVRSTTREWAFRRATEKLQEIGVGVSIEQGEMPKRKGDVAGVTLGSASFAWETSGSKLLPGAIGDNLTSYGGALGESDGQTPLTEFIRNGAAGASGTVTEPYAIQAKFPTPFIHYHYARGCTLAEAFYQSLSGPYQLLIVGDALCAPWKKELTVIPGDLAPATILKGRLQVAPTTRSADGVVATSFEMFLDGRRVAAAHPGKPLDLNTSDISDGHHELVIAAGGNDGSITNGSVRIPIVVRNKDAEVRVTPPPATITWDKPLVLSASSASAASISFFHQMEEVGRITGPSGSVTIDPRILGQGPVRIQPVATLSDSTQILGEPITFRVNPPAPLQPTSSASRLVLANGFTVTPAGGKPVIVQDSNADWLAKAGVKDGEDFTVEGVFKVTTTEVFQFQLRGAAKLRVLVDGRPQDWPRGSEWWFVPVHLAPGRHLLRIEGRASDTSRLEVRFGGPGTRRIEGTRFQHRDTN